MKYKYPLPKYWLKAKVLNHIAFTGAQYCRVHRDFKNNIVTLNFHPAGRSVKYYYDGRWIAE
jgi:hypothetical protein